MFLLDSLLPKISSLLHPSAIVETRRNILNFTQKVTQKFGVGFDVSFLLDGISQDIGNIPCLGWFFAEIEFHKVALLDINDIYLICMESETAKVFWSGRSQAVRLPKKFRFAGNKVHIRRHGDKVILEPLALDWSWLDEIREKLDADCLAAASEKLPMQERKSLETLFE